MRTGNHPDDPPDAATWRESLVAATLQGGSSDVACGTCVACCASSQFVHIAPDELDALAHIPAELVFPAPMRPKGHMVLGYDQNGRCPMLCDDGCSIYAHRPRTCRTYDCRVFTATGVVMDEPERTAIRAASERWSFDTTGDSGRDLSSMRRAGAYLRSHRASLPEHLRPVNPTQTAVLAVFISELFTEPTVEPEQAEVVAAVEAAIGRLRSAGGGGAATGRQKSVMRRNRRPGA